MQRVIGFSKTSLFSTILFLSFFSFSLVFSPAEVFAQDKSSVWAESERLAADQKFEAAVGKVDAILAGARTKNETRLWTEGLIRSTQLRMGLHGYETAVRALKDSKWPDDSAGRVLLNLYYAHSLMAYQQMYSWEIARREKTVSSDSVDLKAWTTIQIGDEISRCFDDIMKNGPALDQPVLEFFKSYVTGNDYPVGVRPVLRDLVVYMAVRHMVNSQYWTARESSEIYKNDVKALVSRPPLRRFSAVSRDEHPLKKAVSWLAEHREFHLKAGRLEAAMNAQYEIFANLHAAISDSNDREVIRRELKSYQSSNRKLAWWSRGQALLAQFVRETNGASREIEAREQALLGVRAFPESIGGKMCAAMIAEIERPDYSVTMMEVDNLGRRSMLVNYKNLSKLYIRAYSIDVNTLLSRTRDGGDLFALETMKDDIKKMRIQPVAEWSVELPKTADFLSHRKFVTPPVKKTGIYTVIFSSRPDFSGSNDIVQGGHVFLSDLVLATANGSDGMIETRVLSGEKGTVVADVNVALYRFKWSVKPELVETKKTASDGIVRFNEPAKSSSDYWNYFLVARKGDHATFELNGIYFGKNSPLRSKSSSLIFTDRSIFRPGQKIFWKIASYSGDPTAGLYKVVPKNTSMTVRLMDPNNQTVESKIVKVGDFGTASGEFTVPLGRPLGNWRVEATGTNFGSASIRVEEYKRPTFEAKLEDSLEPMRLNRKAKIRGSSNYYFGQPVSQGKVSWRVTRQEMYPVWWSWRYWGGGAAAQPEMVASGEAKLNPDGTFNFEFMPEADGRKSAQSSGLTYGFQVEANLTDEGGETQSATRTYRLGFVSVEASILQSSAFFETNRDITLTANLRSLDGKTRSGKAKYRIVKLKQPLVTALPADLPREESNKEFATPDDSKRARWETDSNWQAIAEKWSDGAEVSRGEIVHDAAGAGEIKIKALSDPGIYRILYETKDDFGAVYKLSQNVLVVSGKSNISVPIIFIGLNDSSKAIEAGTKAKFFLHSGLANQSFEIETFRAGKRIAHRTWLAGKDSSFFEVPVTKEDRGGFTIAVSGIRDHQFMREEVSISVPWTDRRLDLEFSTFRDKLRPGTRETFRVTVRNPDKKALGKGAAEVLAYMYDRSLDVFGAHAVASPMSAYPSRIGAVTWNTALGQNSAYHWFGSFNYAPSVSPPHDDYLNFPSNYGIGGPGRRGSVPQSRMGGGLATRMEMADSAPMSKSESSASSLMENKVEAPKEFSGKAKPVSVASDQEGTELRSNFSETAFFEPHLITAADGSVSFEFKVPDSVTAWNVYAHALTKDWRGGFISKETKSVKELMVRPYAPRFLREGDEAEIKVQVSNVSEAAMSGELTFDIENPDSGKSVAKEFGLKAQDLKKSFISPRNGSTTISFSVKAPREVGSYVFRVTAKSKNFSDGELRPFPVLPSRMHLAQSRFVSLKNADSKTLEFKDLAAEDDKTLLNEKMVVTVDAQLFYGVLKSLPYLVNYPYECIEQTLNRFLATGVVSSVFDKYPSIEKMAKEMSSRKTALEAFEGPDANRRMTLEESPWLENAKGGKSDERELAKILDSRVAKEVRENALKRIRKMQLANGAFPWFEGGAPDQYMTLYVLMGFGRALEFKVDVPKDVVQKAWGYTRGWLDANIERMMRDDCCWEFITSVNYAISLYPDKSYLNGLFDEAYRKRLLDFSFKHWKKHSPLLKGSLALTLHRLNRKADAKLVWDSVMDSSKSDDQLGTYWAAEDRSWLWYNDTIETHAFGLRTLMELEPDDKRVDGLVQWLFLNKKLNHWKSTRATSEVIYSLVHYLDKAKSLGVREVVKVDTGTQKTEFVFDPGKYTGAKNQLVIPGEKIDAKRNSKIVVEKSTPGFAFASATWHFSTDRLPAEDRGDFFKVSRAYFRREAVKNAKSGSEWTLKPLADGQKIAIGDQIEVQISLRTKHAAEYIHLRDPRAAGLEPENVVSGYKWDLGITWFEEVRDSGTNFFFSHLPVGEYTFKYRLRANMAGVFRVGPATVQSMYAPEFNAYSNGYVMKVETK